MKRKLRKASEIRSEYLQSRAWTKRLSAGRSSPLRGGVDAWEIRMQARARSIENLPTRDRVLVEERNRTIYSAKISPQLKDLNSWLDERLHDRNYPSAPRGSVWNDPRFGPTVQFLLSRSEESGEPFEMAEHEMARWAASRSSRVAGRIQPTVVRGLAKVSKALSSTGDPLEPFAAPDGKARLQVNDFPDEPLWTLNRPGRKPIQFDDWPPSWSRPTTQRPTVQARGKCDSIWYYAIAQYRDNLASEVRNQDHLWRKLGPQRASQRKIEGTRELKGPKPQLASDLDSRLYSAEPRLALRRWHWRIENRRQAIEKLDSADRGLLSKRAKSVFGGPFSSQDRILVRYPFYDNDYEHFFGIKWGNVSPQPIRYLKGMVQLEEIQYGPTLGYFFAKAARSGGGEEAALALLQEWAGKQPLSYPEFVRQEASGPPDYGGTARLEYWFEKELTWRVKGDFDTFYKTAPRSEGKHVKLTVSVNDFPDERLFSLSEDGMWVGDFNDWPGSWKRS